MKDVGVASKASRHVPKFGAAIAGGSFKEE